MIQSFAASPRHRSGVLLVAIAILPLIAGRPMAQSRPALTEQQARQFAATAEKLAKGSDGAFKSEFDKLVKTIYPKHNFGQIRLYAPSYIVAWAASPLTAFEGGAAEAVRRAESIKDVPWYPGPVVCVETNDEESPHVDRVMVRYDAETVAPKENHLETHKKRFGGNTVDAHEGCVVFEMSAFDPTIRNLQIVIVPDRGKNGVTSLIKSQLEWITESKK